MKHTRLWVVVSPVLCANLTARPFSQDLRRGEDHRGTAREEILEIQDLFRSGRGGAWQDQAEKTSIAT